MPEDLIIKVKLCHKLAKLPAKASPTDSGWDLTAVDVITKGHHIYFMDFGLQIEPPAGYYTQITPRSSIYKIDFIQTNSIGIIDQDYRGNLLLPLRYLGAADGLSAAQALIGQRIAQLLLVKNNQAEIVVSDQLSNTSRGSGGFGSSGQ